MTGWRVKCSNTKKKIIYFNSSVCFIKNLKDIFRMDRSEKLFFYTFTAIILFINTKAQKQNSEIIYESYIHNKMGDWKNVCDQMQQLPNISIESQVYLINFQYGYIAWCIDNDRQKEALKYLDLAENNLQEIQKKIYKPSVINTYKSAFNAFRAGLDNKAALKSGVKSLEYADMAIKEDSANYFAYFQRANIYRHTPELFKGSKKKAIEYYLKAEALIRKDKNIHHPNWNYLNLLVTITETYIEVKDYIAAKKYCDKILKIEPEFHFVKDSISPKIKNHIK